MGRKSELASFLSLTTSILPSWYVLSHHTKCQSDCSLPFTHTSNRSFHACRQVHMLPCCSRRETRPALFSSNPIITNITATIVSSSHHGAKQQETQG